MRVYISAISEKKNGFQRIKNHTRIKALQCARNLQIPLAIHFSPNKKISIYLITYDKFPTYRNYLDYYCAFLKDSVSSQQCLYKKKRKIN